MDFRENRNPQRPPITILNLFAYTGIASLHASAEHTEVCHVDGAKSAINWARRNAELSGLDGNKIRWICDDVMKFMIREIRRGNTYDGIILDPPAFGRGDKKDWKLNEISPNGGKGSKLSGAMIPSLGSLPATHQTISRNSPWQNCWKPFLLLKEKKPNHSISQSPLPKEMICHRALGLGFGDNKKRRHIQSLYMPPMVIIASLWPFAMNPIKQTFHLC
ncbi:hypothetical protein HC823_01315, partial [Candidatus Gracilibacteria bacterium]|nr:hypothetical protein [Candidatus Gracilibacteria bacterium]